MKIAFISDSHFGVRNDSPFFLENAISFYENQFFPYLLENNITEVVHLGDFFDRRKFVNFNTLSLIRTKILNVFEEMKVSLHITIGNHDTYYKNTNKLNSPKELISDRYSNVFLYENPTTIKFDDFCFGIVPWVTEENLQEVLDFLAVCPCRMIGGHFEIVGFQVIPGVKHPWGFDVNKFTRFERVLSGHFHIKQTEGNVYYLGTQYQMNFSDVYSTKGFHVYDTETDEMTFVENNHNIFHLCTYDDSTSEELKNTARFLSNANLHGGFVRLNVRSKSKQEIFDKFVNALWEKGIQDLSVIEEVFEISSNVEFDETQDTMSIINNEIDSIQKDIDKYKLKNIIKDLYMESIKI